MCEKASTRGCAKATGQASLLCQLCHLRKTEASQFKSAYLQSPYLLLEVTYLKTLLHNILNATLKWIRPHCVKRQARDDAQRQQVKLLFFVGFVISVKQKHPSLPYNLPLWSCKPVVDGSPIRCNRQVWVSSTPFGLHFHLSVLS